MAKFQEDLDEKIIQSELEIKIGFWLGFDGTGLEGCKPRRHEPMKLKLKGRGFESRQLRGNFNAEYSLKTTGTYHVGDVLITKS